MIGFKAGVKRGNVNAKYGHNKQGEDGMNIRKHLAMLGLVVTDKVTGFRGVVTSVAFDLYGCIQTIVTPAVGKDGKQEESRWYDIQRLTVIHAIPVMTPPDWDFGSIAEGEKGPAEKPNGKW